MRAAREGLRVRPSPRSCLVVLGGVYPRGSVVGVSPAVLVVRHLPGMDRPEVAETAALAVAYVVGRAAVKGYSARGGL